ncbi:MAG: hypothetical protein E6K78_07590 [Candidatus Eisenbacteria bacterium]|uniref:VWA domain-containing protein n=1 Tax=Eiseniibacteriota bacterium TaxID=2212470 RepID=A0A538TPF4_UNCEI|nr:MAG: hypothetical protein E6K78_07590 [Candidatus Eisenbacteria bacterium]
MIGFSVHLAPNAPWPALVLASVGLVLLGLWAYRFPSPPLPPRARRLLPALRIAALLVLAWLLAQPILERARAGRTTEVVVLVDRSRSMDLPVAARSPSKAPPATRGDRAERAAREIEQAWRGRAAVRVLPFAGRLGTDSTWRETRGLTALGDALSALAGSDGDEPDGVVVVSDGVVNAGQDPIAAARSLGAPVHTVLVGDPGGRDRAVVEVESSARARVGEATPVRVRVTSSEPRGTPLSVRLADGARALGQTTVVAPGSGAEAVAEFRVVPARPGLAVWTASIDSAAGERTTANNARQTALEVAPGRLGVTIVSGGLNWDLTFLRRALLGDSSLAVTSCLHDRSGWRQVEAKRTVPTLGAEALRGQAVVVLDGISGPEIGADFDRSLAAFARSGGGLLLLGGASPGIQRLAAGALAADLALAIARVPVARGGMPVPSPAAREVLAWDDDPARGDQAWRAAAPLTDPAPIQASAGDRVFIASEGGGPPLLLARRVGRGQALLVNGAGLWRWSLAEHDDLASERGNRLWRLIVRWLAEPVQGEPLRVRPERWLSPHGESVRLLASLQDEQFRPLAGATVEAYVQSGAGRATRAAFTAREPGSYDVSLAALPPGRYRVRALASRAGREIAQATSEFAVDRWSLEEARSEPDSATLASLAAATGGRMTSAAHVANWARSLPTRTIARERSESFRLWESRWTFFFLVAALSLEWAWRRRRGLP